MIGGLSKGSGTTFYPAQDFSPVICIAAGQGAPLRDGRGSFLTEKACGGRGKRRVCSGECHFMLGKFKGQWTGGLAAGPGGGGGSVCSGALGSENERRDGMRGSVRLRAGAALSCRDGLGVEVAVKCVATRLGGEPME